MDTRTIRELSVAELHDRLAGQLRFADRIAQGNAPRYVDGVDRLAGALASARASLNVAKRKMETR